MDKSGIDDSTERNKQTTIRVARITSGFTKEDVSSRLDISISNLRAYETDSSALPIRTAHCLLDLYNVPFNSIFFGREIDFEPQQTRDE